MRRVPRKGSMRSKIYCKGLPDVLVYKSFFSLCSLLEGTLSTDQPRSQLQSHSESSGSEALEKKLLPPN
jgi:hypothetical protein